MIVIQISFIKLKFAINLQTYIILLFRGAAIKAKNALLLMEIMRFAFWIQVLLRPRSVIVFKRANAKELNKNVSSLMGRKT